MTTPTVPTSNRSTYGYGGYNTSHSAVAEAFRTLRTNLQFAAVDRELKVIEVTSATPDEGKTTVAQYLAQTVSQTGKKVMLVDADLINPTLHRHLGIPNQRGLSNLIVGDVDTAVFTRLKDFPNLAVITAGPIPPNSSELLGSMRMKHLVDRLREEYDMIILDTPPLLPVTDAVVASAYADGVLLVVQTAHCRSGELAHAYEALENAHAQVLGVVLNRAKRRTHDYYYAHYGHYTTPAEGQGDA